jgi:CheY-like chemotaxis protein
MTEYILVAGENENNLALIRKTIKDLDYEIVKAPSMSLALFLAQKNRPILIFADARLVDGDPLTFTKVLKSDEELMSIPLAFLLTEKMALSMKDKLIQSGANAVLTNEKQASQFVVNAIAK